MLGSKREVLNVYTRQLNLSYNNTQGSGWDKNRCGSRRRGTFGIYSQ